MMMFPIIYLLFAPFLKMKFQNSKCLLFSFLFFKRKYQVSIIYSLVFSGRPYKKNPAPAFSNFIETASGA